MHKKVILNCPFLDSQDPSFVTSVVIMLRPLLMNLDEWVMQEGTIGVEMYLLQVRSPVAEINSTRCQPHCALARLTSCHKIATNLQPSIRLEHRFTHNTHPPHCDG